MNATIVALAIVLVLLVAGIAIISLGSAPQAGTTAGTIQAGGGASSPQLSSPDIAGVPYVPVYSGGGCAR